MLLHLDIDILNIPSYTQLDLEFYFEKKRYNFQTLIHSDASCDKPKQRKMKKQINIKSETSKQPFN
jgi:hypothetical protein